MGAFGELELFIQSYQIIIISCCTKDGVNSVSFVKPSEFDVKQNVVELLPFSLFALEQIDLRFLQRNDFVLSLLLQGVGYLSTISLFLKSFR